MHSFCNEHLTLIAILKDVVLFCYWNEIRIDWLTICCSTSLWEILHSYGDASFAGKWLQHLGLCSTLMELSRGGSSSCRAVTQGLGFCGLIYRIIPLSRFVRQAGVLRASANPNPRATVDRFHNFYFVIDTELQDPGKLMYFIICMFELLSYYHILKS